MNTITEQNHAVAAAAAKSFGVQRPMNVTTVIAENSDYVFTKYFSGQSTTYKISHKKQVSNNQLLLIGSDGVLAMKKWEELLATGTLSRVN